MKTKNEFGNWSIGKNSGCVITDLEPNKEDLVTGHGDTKYYGGTLVCESIRTPNDAKLISCAPGMLEKLNEALEAIDWYMQNTTPNHNQYQTHHDLGMNILVTGEELIKKATE